MSPASKPVRPGRQLAAVAVVLAALYGAVFAGHPHGPKLGLDLRGGTEVILTAVAPHGGRVTKSAMNQSVNIIRQRVNGLGVSEAQVTTQGNDNIVVAVPGKGRDQVVKLVGQTAQLRFRQVLQFAAGTPSTPAASPSATPSPTTSAKPTSSAKASASATPAASGAATPSPGASASPAPVANASAHGVRPRAGDYAPTYQALSTLFAKLNCNSATDRAGAGSDPTGDYIIACNQGGPPYYKFLLSPAKVQGSDISSASYGLQTSGNGITTNQWQVNLSFKSHGSSVWGNWTAQVTKLPDIPNCGPPTGCNAIAVVLDDQVVSYPRIVQAIYGGQSQITGSFSQAQASNLADVLRYGALPLRFSLSAAQTVSASLGSDQLRGGLIAGIIGLGLVVLYSLLYYRGLGLVTIASLVLSGALLYPAVTLLGRSSLGYTLSLAGIAGFIVAVGITADSFVVFFERIRDEIRDGRTLRSAVERAWPRARRTILSADTVSLLAALILWLLSIGDVRGFAFTLGLSTLSDLFIVFTFTKPLLSLLARTRLYGSGGAFSGLSADRMGVSLAPAPRPPQGRQVTPKAAR